MTWNFIPQLENGFRVSEKLRLNLCSIRLSQPNLMFAMGLKISELWDYIRAVFIGQVFWEAEN